MLAALPRFASAEDSSAALGACDAWLGYCSISVSEWSRSELWMMAEIYLRVCETILIPMARRR